MIADLAIAGLSAASGGLAVYLVSAARPQPFDEPRGALSGGVTILQATGHGVIRARFLLAFAALCACLFFLLGVLLNR